MKREMNEMTNAERIALYSEGVGYLGFVMFGPKHKKVGRQELPLRVELEKYFTDAGDMERAFEVICGRMVIVDRDHDRLMNAEAAPIWAAFLDSKGLASYDVLGYSGEDIASMYRDRAYLHTGVPILTRYLIAYLLEPGKALRKLMKQELVNAGLNRKDVNYLSTLIACVAAEYAMRRTVVHELIVMNSGIAA